MTVAETCALAKEHVCAAANLTEESRNRMLTLAAQALCSRAQEIIKANEKDISACTRTAIG